MTTDVLCLIDELVLNDLLLTRQIKKAAELRKFSPSRPLNVDDQLKEQARQYYRKVSELRELGGDEAIDALSRRVGRVNAAPSETLRVA